MITCQTKTTIFKSRPKYIDLASFIIEAKNCNQYYLANQAFACLLRQSIDSSVHIYWESTNNYSNTQYNNVSANCYKDLIVLNNNNLKVNMPCTLLKPKFMELTFYQAEKKVIPPKDRWVHKRVIKPCLPGQVEYLTKKLTKLVPNFQEIANIYLANKP